MSTPILPFAVWASGTNQNSVPANDNSLRHQILNGKVISQSVTAQPGSPTEGDIYILASTHTGAQWAGFTAKDLVIFSGGTWYAFAPVEGVVVNVAGSLFQYASAAWASVSAGFTGGTLTSALNEAPPVTLASAATVNIGAAAANSITISGTTTITAFDSIAAGAVRRVTFSGALILTHNATSLILPTGANLTTAAGDVAEFQSLGSGNWRCDYYSKASGAAVLPSSFTGGTLTSALNEAPQVALASAATVNIGAAAANTVTVSGTTTITAFDSLATGAIRRVRFLGILTLTHNATSLILPGSANITTAAGDVATMESLGSGNWRCINYARADGTAVSAPPGSGTVTSVDASGGVETASGSAITATGTVRAAELVNAQTGTTYTYLTGDRGKLVTHSNASAIAGTLPQAGGTFPAGWFMDVRNLGAGSLTVTPTTSTIDGAATLVLDTGQFARIVSDGTNYQISDKSGGYINLPQNSKSAAYTTVLSDQGKHLLHPAADTTARTFTIDSNANVPYAIGTALTFVNQNAAGTLTIAITSDTMRLAGAGTTGSRTLAANGIATALKITSTEWIISGTGLT